MTCLKDVSYGEINRRKTGVYLMKFMLEMSVIF